MTNWKEYRLGELLGTKGYIRGPFGSALRRPEMKSEGYAVYEQQHAIYNTRDFRYFIDENKFAELNRFSIRANDLIISCSGTVGEVSIINEDDPQGIISQALLTLRPNLDLVKPQFLYYFFKTRNGHNQLLSASHGSVQVNIAKREVVESIPVSIPDIETQDSIIEILSSLDDKIELNNKINQELENLAQTLFKQWFIDFEFPNENGEPYKSSGGEMVESELGEIPKGWEVKSLDEIADYLNGLALQKFPAQEGEDYLPVIKIRELRQGITQASDKASTEVPDKYIIQNGDVLFAWSGSLMIDFWTNGEGALNQHLFKVTSENYPKWFYFYWTKYHLDEFIKIAESKATTMGHIQRKHLTEAKVTVPNSNHLNQFNDNFENIVESIISNREENQELTNLRDTLLPKLISGELEVAEVMAENA